MVNYIKSGSLNSRLFKQLCKDMNADHEVLFYYTEVRWLSKGNMVNRFYELKEEIKIFMEMQGKYDFAACFDDESWLCKIAYLSDILEQQNILNLRLQGRELTIIEFQDNLRTFIAKLQNWRSKIDTGNIVMFGNLSYSIEELKCEITVNFKKEMTKHLQSLENELVHYFPELTKEEALLVRYPFSDSIDISSIPDDVQNDFLDLRNDSAARHLYNENLLTQFWCAMYHSYPKVTMIAFRILIPFASTYLCESGFSTLLQLKSKSRNRLNVNADMMLALTQTQPRILKLVNELQFQPSH